VDGRPDIIVSTVDHGRLTKLLDELPRDDFAGRRELEADLERAKIVEPEQVPPSVVTMNSTVRFSVADSSDEFELRLVYPKDAETDGRTISILAPVGGALLGLAEGDEIDWPKPGGGTQRVRIQEVTYQPERAGEFHR
jgi:regulator of nucleoside diphosphate kinase